MGSFPSSHQAMFVSRSVYFLFCIDISRKVASSCLSSPLAVQATFPLVWVGGSVLGLERLSFRISLRGVARYEGRLGPM